MNKYGRLKIIKLENGFDLDWEGEPAILMSHEFMEDNIIQRLDPMAPIGTIWMFGRYYLMLVEWMMDRCALQRVVALEEFVDWWDRPAYDRLTDRRTPPTLFATTTCEMTFRRNASRNVLEEFLVAEGTPVKALMYSRLGDIGVTTLLDSDRDYENRIDPTDGRLKDFRTQP